MFFLRGWIIKLWVKDPIRQRNLLAKNTSYISTRLLKPFKIKVNLINPENLKNLKQENHLIVSNHVSYTDILVLASCYPFVFITSVEMSATPLLGAITRIGGSLFTNRKKYTSLPQEIQNFSNALTSGFDVVLFPEGTSTNGLALREFKKSLFQTSISAQKPVLPICVKYHTLDGQPITSQEQRDVVCWYGDMTFLPHFWKILRHQVEADVTVLDPIPYDPAVHRQQLCETVYERIVKTFSAYSSI